MFKNLGENTIKSLLTGVVAGVGSVMVFGETQSSNIVGMVLPSYLVIGGSAFAGSWVSDMVSDNIIRRIPQNPNWANAESLVVRLGVAGLATAGALKLTTGLPNENIPKAIALGAGAKIGGEWISNNVIFAKRSGFIIPK